MVSSRTATAIAGLVASLALSLVAWQFLGWPFFFLFVPFVPFLLRRGDRSEPPEKECPRCGFRTRNPAYDHCPRDGERLTALDE